MTTITPKHPPANDAALLACEREIGLSIPFPYRSFLATHNGGAPCPDGFTYEDQSGSRSAAGVNGFLGVHDGQESIARYVRTFRNRIPKEFFPIASDGGGNLVLLAAAGPNAGHVFFWHHELEADEGETPDYRNVFHVADSFDAFLAGLRELEE